MHFNRLRVAEEKAVCGIIRQTDITRAGHSALGEVESRRRTLATELADLVRRD